MNTIKEKLLKEITTMSDGELFDLATTLVETLKIRQNGQEPKRGRKPKYNSDEERKRVREAVRKARIADRNKRLLAEGKPIPKRGRPSKAS